MKRQLLLLRTRGWRMVFGGAFAWLVCGAGIVSLRAADAPPDGAEAAGSLFDRLDANHDGSLTADEIPADKQPLFERLLRSGDKDKSGSLSRQELIEGLKTQRPARELEDKSNPPGGPAGLPDPEQLFNRLDANGDGKVTADEVPPQGRDRFEQLMARADKNNDGGLNEDEFVAAMNAVKLFQGFKGSAPEPPAKSQASPSESAKSETPSTGGEPASDTKGGKGKAARLAKLQERGFDTDRMVSRLMKGDKNGDGKLSRDELPDQVAKRFEKLDTNSDGVLDESEVRAGVDRLKKMAGDLKN